MRQLRLSACGANASDCKTQMLSPILGVVLLFSNFFRQPVKLLLLLFTGLLVNVECLFIFTTVKLITILPYLSVLADFSIDRKLIKTQHDVIFYFLSFI